jgi:hypothetical protein
MPLSAPAMDRLLPPGRPPEGGTPDALYPDLSEVEGGADGPEGRALLWFCYLSYIYRSELDAVRKHFSLSDTKDYLVQPSVGFFPLDNNLGKIPASPATRELSYFFGAVLYDMRAESAELGPFRLPSTPSFEVYRFPIVFVPDQPLDPANAASTCWAESQSGIQGVLTCKHAVAGISRNGAVRMVDGSTGALVDFTDGSVDAAFIKTGSGLPIDAESMAIMDRPKEKNEVLVYFRSVGVINAQILNAWYFPDNSDAYNPMRLFIDTWAQSGDSGSLVSMQRSKKGAGIYTGRMQGNNTTQGVCQYLKQAVDLLKVSAFS